MYIIGKQNIAKSRKDLEIRQGVDGLEAHSAAYDSVNF